MNGHHLQISLEELADGVHERCAWCHAPFIHTQGKWQRFKALDGKYYCDETHASAPFLTPRRSVLS
jgi:hypothetical protein